MVKHLTTTDKIKTSVRFVSDKLDARRVDPYIGESEQMDIKNQIGEALFVDLLDYASASDKSAFPDYSMLLDGGIYEVTDRRGCKEKRMFSGLIEALNYYVWARLVKNNNYTVTRAGTVNKTDPYSANAELKERLIVEKDALSIADKYLGECIAYLSANRDKFPLFNTGRQSNRFNFKIVD